MESGSSFMLGSQASQVPVSSSSPLPPFTVLCDNHFVIWWWKIVGAVWDFEVNENQVVVKVTLPAPTSQQLQAYCGEGVGRQFSPVTLVWELIVPQNIILIPNVALCKCFKDDAFVGIRVPVRTIEERVTLRVE